MPTTPGPAGPPTLRAAGALPWRRRRGTLEVALVHRPAYDDWAWSKGKLDGAEEFPTAAVREVEEETGLRVRLGRPLPASEYAMVDKAGRPTRKRVRYWAAEVTGGDGRLVNEIDEVAWLDPAAAFARLDYARDREQLRALVRHDQEGTLTTWPLVVVRHAHARPRSSWTGDDRERPLDARGVRRSREIVPLLDAFGVSRLVTSSSTRCVQTLEPYARAAGLPLRAKGSLTEETFAVDPDKAVRRLHKTLERGQASALCSHGPVLPALLEELLTHVDTADLPGRAIAATLTDAADSSMAKGELLVCHLVGQGSGARVVAVERYLP